MHPGRRTTKADYRALTRRGTLARMGHVETRAPCAAVLAVALFLRATPAHARSPFEAFPGLELGLHLGVAHPGGQVGGGSAATTPTVGAVAPTWVPLGLDAGLRLLPHVYMGATLDWGPTIEHSLGDCFECNVASDLQLGGEVRFYLAPTHLLDPWVSLGAGWESLHLALGSVATSSATYDGPVLAALKVGLDVRSRAIAVGPYFGVSFGEYLSRSLEPAPPGESSEVGARAVHEWFVLGLRGAFGPYVTGKR